MSSLIFSSARGAALKSIRSLEFSKDQGSHLFIPSHPEKIPSRNMSTLGLLILQDLIFFKGPIYSFLLALSPRWAFTQSTLSSNNPKQSYQLCMYDLYSLCVLKDHEIRFSQYICNLSLVAQAMHGCMGWWWILSVFSNLNKYLQNNPVIFQQIFFFISQSQIPMFT